MIGHKYTPTVGHTGSYAFGDHVRRNLGATVVELGIPPALAVGSVNSYTLTIENNFNEVVNLSNNPKLDALVKALPEFYQPIYGHNEWDDKPLRSCEDRLVVIKKIYDDLSAKLQRPLRVLDLGCCLGYFSLNIAKWGGVYYRRRFQCEIPKSLRIFGRRAPGL